MKALTCINAVQASLYCCHNEHWLRPVRAISVETRFGARILTCLRQFPSRVVPAGKPALVGQDRQRRGTGWGQQV